MASNAEAALRMLHNNLDPEVAERPEELVVYDGASRPHRKPDDPRPPPAPHLQFRQSDID